MANMILVDYETIQDEPVRAKVKNFIIEYLIGHPDTLVTVINARFQAQGIETSAQLSAWQFPKDGILVNPLTLDTPSLVFKTMFAATAQEAEKDYALHPDNMQRPNRIVLVIDSSEESLSMWKSSGVNFGFNPTSESAANSVDS